VDKTIQDLSDLFRQYYREALGSALASLEDSLTSSRKW
jgi:hypothetical protein